MEYENKFILGDMKDIVPQLPNEIFDLFIFDIPYNMKKKIANDNLSKEKYERLLKEWIKISVLKLKPTGSFYCFINDDNLCLLKQILDQSLLFKRILHWQKEAFSKSKKDNYEDRIEYCLFYTKSNEYIFNQMHEKSSLSSYEKNKKKIDNNGNIPYNKLPPQHKKRYKKENYNKNPQNVFRGANIGNIFKIPTCSRGSNPELKWGNHPTQKPKKLIEIFIKVSSNEGDLVGDFFVGSGTTLVCAKRLRRKYFGCEIMPKYYKLAKKRLENTHQFKNILKYTSS